MPATTSSHPPSCAAGTPALRASGLVKRFGSAIAVDHVDVEVRPGEVRGLLGPNGAGKTLLRMLFGSVAPDAGPVILGGRPLRVTDRSALAGVAGFVEDPSFYPYLSGRANLQRLAELDGGARISPLESMFFALTDGAARRPVERRAPADALVEIP